MELVSVLHDAITVIDVEVLDISCQIFLHIWLQEVLEVVEVHNIILLRILKE
jgi:hypothetical protein